MFKHLEEINPSDAQSSAGGATLTDVLERDQARDAFYKGADRGDPMHWRDIGPDELWNTAWDAAVRAERKACANVCDSGLHQVRDNGWIDAANERARCAAAIRERSN